MESGIQSVKSMFRRPELGLLVIRVSVGLIFIYAGYNKFMAGEETLNNIGSNVKYLGLDVGVNTVSSMFFGIAAAGAEVLGGALLAVGFLTRVSTFFLIITMLVATLYKLDSSVVALSEFGFPLVMGLVCLGLLFTGPGRYSIQKD